MPVTNEAPATPVGAPASGGRGNTRLRLLDRTLALLVLAVLGVVRRKRQRPPAPRRIGLMKTAGIGDMILLTATARDVIAAFPDAEVVVFAGPDNADVARLISGIRTVRLATTQPLKTLQLLRAEHLDVLVDFGQWTRLEGIYSALSGAGWTVGFNTSGQRRHYAYDATVSHSNEVHEIENYRQLATAVGVPPDAEPSFDRSADGPAPLDCQPYVVFHLWPGGFRSELREWSQDRWRELAQIIVSEGHTIVLTGGPGDRARTDAFIESCGDLAPHMVSVAGEFKIPELVNVIADARCVVSVNTGVMHLAGGVGVPTIALNGPTSSRRWGPLGRDVTCIDSELPGCGFLDLGFEYEGQRTDCMDGISVTRVAEAALGRGRA
jgi:ADP-heptose:LPS heptosyltransferase